MAHLWLQAEEPERALREFTASMPVLNEVLGPDHPLTLNTIAGLLGARCALDDRDGLLEAWADLRRRQERVLGALHPDTLLTRNNWAGQLGAAGDPAAAVRAFEELIPILVEALDEGHPYTTLARRNQEAWRSPNAESANSS